MTKPKSNPKPRGGARKNAGRKKKPKAEKRVKWSVMTKPTTRARLKKKGIHPGQALDDLADG